MSGRRGACRFCSWACFWRPEKSSGSVFIINLARCLRRFDINVLYLNHQQGTTNSRESRLLARIVEVIEKPFVNLL